MTASYKSILDTAQTIAETVLLPRANQTDAANLLPLANLQVLANEGFYGMLGPPSAGGWGLSTSEASNVVEALASGCLTTTFVFLQHHTAVQAVSSSQNEALRASLLPALCSGQSRAGIIFEGYRKDAWHLRAKPGDGGWLLDGTVRLVTGWRAIDFLYIAALTEDDRLVRGLVAAGESATLQAQPENLAVLNASDTVTLTFRGHFLPDSHVTRLEPTFVPSPTDGGGRLNGSLALGVTRRCAALLGSEDLEGALSDCKARLDNAQDDIEMAQARSRAALLALSASSRLVVSEGSNSLLISSHAQRLAREALFCLVFGSRPQIKQAIQEALSGFAERPPVNPEKSLRSEPAAQCR